jgi:hypothetical protein
VSKVCDRAQKNHMSQNLEKWCEDFGEACRESSISSTRIETFERALGNRHDELYAEARSHLDEERSAKKKLDARVEGLALSPFEVSTRLLFGCVDLLVALISVFLVLGKNRPLLATDEKTFRGWGKVYAAFVAAGSVATVATLVFGGIIVDHKQWVGLDSYDVSQLTWSFGLVSVLGGVLMLSHPVAILFRLGDRAFIPAVNPEDPRGDCGVGSYVTFLHVWTMIGAVIAVTPVVFWLRYLRTAPLAPANIYLVPAFFGLGVVLIVGYRLVRNAVYIRQDYRDALTELGTTTVEVDGKKPAPDPTIPFIGEDWWKLPTLVGGGLVAAWVFLEWTGAAQLVLDAVH